jgi:ABC-2 type transport system ATP-binding protein
VGFLPERPVLPEYLKVGEFLAGLPSSRSDPEKGEGEGGAERSPVHGVGALLHRPISSLSMGQRKKVALAAALRDGPEILLLDEPTNGLDPLATVELREILRTEKTRGVTLIVSSHHLDELQRVADTVVFLKDGREAGEWCRSEALEEFGTLEALFRHVFGGG